jgi:hypothetical protein
VTAPDDDMVGEGVLALDDEVAWAHAVSATSPTASDSDRRA